MVATKASLGELSSYGVARSTVKGAPLSDEELRKAARVLAGHELSRPGHDLPSGQPAAA